MFQPLNSHSKYLAAYTAAAMCVFVPNAILAEEPSSLDNSRWQDIAVVDTVDHDKDDKNLSFTNEASIADDNADIPGDPHHGSSTWLMPDPQTQLLRDAKLQTVTTGGVFVPAMSLGINEPRFQIRDKNNEIIYEGQTGTTAYIAQGDYTVTVGSVVTGERPEFDVHVAEGAITTVPVEWSGLIIKVVNDRGTPIRSNYEIVSIPERAYIGLGTGALINEGELLSTWLLWPGRYMIISAGEGYQARKNFITVKLEPGELSRVTLVLDEDGNILGGGEIDSDVDALEERWWWASILLGGSIRFNRTDNVVGKVTGQLLDISAFVDSSFTLGREMHYLYARLNAEIGGTVRFEERPFITTVDELNLDLLYTYRFIDWFGPYGRFSFESNMAPSWHELNGNYTVEKLDNNANISETLLNQTEIKLAPPFSPLKLNAGAGGRFDFSAGTWFKLAARLGLAYRYVYTHNLFVPSIDDDEKLVILMPVDSSSQFGLEAAATLDLTPVTWFTLKVDASLLDPFDDMKAPIVDLDVDAAFRLSSIASLSYTLRLNYDISLIDKVQIDQFIQIRFSYKVY